MFEVAHYIAPDFALPLFADAPDAVALPAPCDGVVPDDFYATTIFPEYFKINGEWVLVEGSRMDCCIVIEGGRPYAREFRNVIKGDAVVTGRTEDGSNGVFVHSDAFAGGSGEGHQAFAFRTGKSRETSYSMDYDLLYELLRHDRDHGYIVFVLGPAVTFDYDSRRAMVQLIENGYVDALFAGNALATHDLEAAFFHTALGQDIYTKTLAHNGHYHHIETINRARKAGSIAAMVEQYGLDDGIMCACLKKGIPFVLAGSIRDDGPLPEVIANAYEAQDAMRKHTGKATTVIGLATQLHSIATGNMTPAYQVVNGVVRPVYFYTVDVSEFAVNKLRDRGSLSVTSIITNIQDFLVNSARKLMG